ncbi:protein kintoun-like, partial [Brachionichthys hirsutus]|uniref:protein kintoun-like n=1 Tax=Brachionichthys hirsutus TaxID=412623 RepID=UPI00360483B2
MELGHELKDLDITAEEMDKLSKAFKDEKFLGIFTDFAKELSDPENQKRYEEEIKIMERERGQDVEFVHPKPFRCLKTSVDGKQECFINICSNERVEPPSSAPAAGGRRWTLPHFLHPGRPERDPKGNKMVIYDVIFHPETLHMANRRASFMDVVASTAMRGIQSSFDVTLDENNASESSASYKGTPRPCVIRGPVPGYEEKKRPMEEPDPLAFPYPDEKPTIGQAATTKPPETRSRGAAPTRPSHAVKYRSSTDVQDFARSGDAIRGCRPKEIVVTVDLPLLRAARDASLEVREGRLLLESKEPAYRLELPLAYPVDEDEGAATFDKERRRLTVTLPVVPSRPGALDFAAG